MQRYYQENNGLSKKNRTQNDIVLQPKSEIKSDKEQNEIIPPSFTKHKGLDNNELHLPIGTSLKENKKGVVFFKIGDKLFNFDQTTGKYISDDGTVYSVPRIQIPKSGLNQPFSFSNSDQVYNIAMNVKIEVFDAPGSGLQMIQTNIATARYGGRNDSMTFASNLRRHGMDYREMTDGSRQVIEHIFVDGGKGSINDIASKGEINTEQPYYCDEARLNYMKKEEQGMYNWRSDNGFIHLTDKPDAVLAPWLFARNLFETSVVLKDWLGTNQDIILCSFQWGYDNSNCDIVGKQDCIPNPIHSGNSPDITKPSQDHIEIIALRYGNYVSERLLPKYLKKGKK